MAEVVAGASAGDKVSTVVCDLDGVVYVEKAGIPGAGEALARLRNAGIALVFVTNNSTKTSQMVVDDIEAVTGFTADRARVVTSGMATAHYLQGRVRSAFVVGGEGLARALEEVGIEIRTDWEAADAVVAGLDRALSYDKLKAATLALRSGAMFVASNVDATFPGTEGLYPGGGSIVAALETASGVAAVVCGKPYPPTRELVRSVVAPGRVVVVGDRPETDLAIAKAEGWGSVLVLTGVITDAAAVAPEYTPDAVLASIAELPEYLGIEG
jgi:4-nitrophenyl phosphatase